MESYLLHYRHITDEWFYDLDQIFMDLVSVWIPRNPKERLISASMLNQIHPLVD